MRKYLAFYENEWPVNIEELVSFNNGPFVGYLKNKAIKFTGSKIPDKPQEDPDDITVPYVTFTAQQDNSSIGLEKLSSSQIL